MVTLTDPTGTDPLTAPSHSTLHTEVNTELRALGGKVADLESAGPGISENIRQARLVANTWTVAGTLTAGIVNKLMLPVLWNLTDRASEFEAARATVFTAPAGVPIEIDLVVAATMTSDAYNLAGPQDSILTSKLVIPAGSTTSATIGASDFVTDLLEGSWVTAVVTQIGTTTPGAGLTIQLNRLL